MADQIRATPQNATLGAIANLLKQTYAPQRTQQMQGMMEFLGLPALARTVERVSYGEPVTNINKANVPLLPADTGEAAMLAGPPLASLAKRVGTNLVQTAPYVARDMAQSMSSPLRSYVVKPKGGNWLAGSVERAVEPMRRKVMGYEPSVRLQTINKELEQASQAGLDPETMQTFMSQIGRERARLEPDAAMNKWLDQKLGKYIRNEMATPEDPLRLQADAFPAIKAEQLAVKDAQLAKARADMEAARQARGFTPEMMTSSQARIRDLERERDFIDAQMGIHAEVQPTGYNVTRARREAGFPEEGMGVSDLAKKWEDRADTFVNELEAFDLTSAYPEVLKDNPWLLKVPPETRVYDMLRGADEDLGFAHLTDELRNALNPESGLPRELLLKYSDLDKMSVPQVAKRVDEINAWRSVQKAEADMARAGNAATQVVKEYPEQGFKWVELRKPESTGKKATVERSELDELGINVDDATLREVAEDMAFDEGLEEGTREFNDYVAQTIRAHNTKVPTEVDESIKILEDALKYEGETMGHCVGGYCPDVSEGRSKIFSLRDKKGQPHVTIEVSPRRPTVEQATKIAIDEGLPPKGIETLERVAQIMSDPAFSTQDIVQIKGKGNKAPKEDYLPAVQDFVRSGKFGKVGDLGNTGLVDVSQAGPLMKALQDIYGRNMSIGMEKFNAAADAMPDAQRFMTKDELLKFLGETPPEGFARGGAVRGYQAGGAARTLPELHQRYAEGGAVTGANFPTDDYDPARIDAIVAGLQAEMQS
jgi:hypothetical protein